MKYKCVCIKEGAGASTSAIHCRHSPWLQTWDKLRIWARELLLTLLQHLEKHFVNPFMSHPSTTYTAPSPQTSGSCSPCSSGGFKSFTVPSLTQQSAMSQVEPSGFSWKPRCQCSHWQTSQQHDCIRRVEDTCIQSNWQRPKPQLESSIKSDMTYIHLMCKPCLWSTFLRAHQSLLLAR